MALFDFTKRLTLGMKIIYTVVAVGVIAAITIGIIVSRNNNNAKSMKVLDAEGTVRVVQTQGGTKNAYKKMRFQSGDSLITGIDGTVSVALDDSKTVALNSDSRAEFIKQDRHLELRLTKGGLFFEVSEKLNDGETFEIKTSALTAGIRGTSGYIFYDEQERDSLIVTDGVVIVTVSNPDTGEKKYAEVNGGQKLTVVSNADFVIEDIGEEDLPDFVLLTIAENDSLLDKVCVYNGWSRAGFLELVDQIITSSASASADAGFAQASPDELTAASEETAAKATSTPKASESASASQTEKPDAVETTETEAARRSADPEATATPKPGATNTPVPTKKPTATPKPIAIATPTKKPTNTPTPTPEPTNTNTPTPEPTNTNTPTPEPTEIPEPELVGFVVTVEVVTKADDGTETTDEVTLSNVPVDGGEPSSSYIDGVLSGYSDYRIISVEPVYE